MLRITRLSEDDESVTLRLEGRLIGPWVTELKRECKRCLARRSKIILDLSSVSFADQEGIQTLKAMRGEHVRLSGESLFLSGLLQDEQDEQDEQDTKDEQ